MPPRHCSRLPFPAVIAASVSRWSHAGPRNANGAISAPVLTPVTSSNCGRLPLLVRPTSAPAPKAPPAPPPEMARMSTSPSEAAARRRERIWLEPVHSERRSAERMRTLAGKPRGAVAPVTSEGALPRGSVVHAARPSSQLAYSARGMIAGDVRHELELTTIAHSQLLSRRLRGWQSAHSRGHPKLLSLKCDRVRPGPDKIT